MRPFALPTRLSEDEAAWRSVWSVDESGTLSKPQRCWPARAPVECRSAGFLLFAFDACPLPTQMEQATKHKGPGSMKLAFERARASRFDTGSRLLADPLSLDEPDSTA